MESVEQVSALDLKLLLGNLQNVVRMVSDDIAYGADMRQLVPDDKAVDRNLLLAERVGIEGIDDVLCIGALGKRRSTESFRRSSDKIKSSISVF